MSTWEFIKAVCSEESLCLALFLFFFSPWDAILLNRYFTAVASLLNVVAGVEGGRMAEIMELNAQSWLRKAGHTVPRKWRNKDDFLFNHSFHTAPQISISYCR